MWMMILAAWLVSGVWEVTVTPLAGQPVTGNLVRLSPEGVAVNTVDGEQTFDIRNVLTVAQVRSLPLIEKVAKVRVEFADGSHVGVDTFAVRQGLATMQLTSGESFETKTRAIKAVRFQPPSPALNAQWEESLQGMRDGDQIIVRKMTRTANDEKSEIALDRLTGIIQDVTDDVVKFQFDGDTIDVRREKLEGIIYFQSANRELADPVCRVTDISLGIWNARTVQWTGERLEFETPVGVRMSLPGSQVLKIDYSVANTQFLSDLEPDSVEWNPYFESPATAGKLAKLFQPRRDSAFDGGRLLLHGQSYEKGLAIHSRTTMIFRLPREARRFVAVAGIDDRVQESGHVRFVVSGDGKPLFEQEISGKGQPVELNLDVAGVRRLTLFVDYGDGLDIGDHLLLCNARITK